MTAPAALFASHALAQFTQQGPKLVGTGGVGTPARMTAELKIPGAVIPRSVFTQARSL
jgi:hypothetical protein